jgi:hypothetical protein
VRRDRQAFSTGNAAPRAAAVPAWRAARWPAAPLAGLALTVHLVGCGAGTSSDSAPTVQPALAVRLALDEKESRAAAFEVVGLPPDDAARLARAEWGELQWNAVLAVYVSANCEMEGDLATRPRSFDRAHVPSDRPAVLGTHRIENGVLRFEPQYPLQPGVAYDVVLNLSNLPRENAIGDASQEANKSLTNTPSEALVQRFVVPKPDAVATTVVERVYPTADELPENLLKFYLHFSAAMSRGEAYRRIHLLDSAGREVKLPFLELDEELWDPGGRRFTLFFDPGRVKRELVPRLEMGPVLTEGSTYTLVVDKDWLDANGNRLREPFRKKFRVVAPDYRPPAVESWKVASPMAGTRAALNVSFPEPLDQALLVRLLWVENDRGETVPGSIDTTDAETRWLFTPQVAWQAGAYRLQVDTTLEDLAGNSIGQPFEIDAFESVEPRVESKRISIPFDVRPGGPAK